MMTLRIIDNVWRYEKQSRNAQEIARRAGALYDKVRIILEDMDQASTRAWAPPDVPSTPPTSDWSAATATWCGRSSSSGNSAPT